MKNTSIKTNVALNMVKQGLSLLFPLITVPYVSQHLGVQGYGEYNYAASIVSYLSYFAAMGISTYAVREGALLRNDRQAEEKLCSQLFTINIITTCIAMGIISFYCFYGVKTTAEKEYIFILSLSIVFTTIGVEWINQIYEDFAFLTIRYIVIQLLSIILLFMFVKTTADVAQYCLVTVIASAGAGVLNIFHIRKYVNIKLTWKPKIKKHLPHMFVFFLSTFATVIYVNSDITMIGSMLGSYEVGLYSLSSKIYNIIKTLLYTVVSTAIPRVTFLYNANKTEYESLIKKIYKILSLIVIPVMTGLISLAAEIIAILGGVEYKNAEAPLVILSLAIPFAIYASYYSCYRIIVAGNEKVMLCATIASAAVNMVLNFVLVPRIGISGAAITTVLAEIINYLISRIYVIRIQKVQSASAGVFARVSICSSIMIWMVSKIVRCIIPSVSIMASIVKCAMTVMVSVVVYGALIFKIRDKEVLSFINECIPEKVKNIMGRRI